MNPEQRRAAAAAYKDRAPDAGVYALRCGAAGLVWVGAAPDLAAIEHRLAFALRHGAGRFPDLEATRAAHGPDAFAFEVLERFDPDDPAVALRRRDLLKQRAARWREALGARPL